MAGGGVSVLVNGSRVVPHVGALGNVVVVVVVAALEWADSVWTGEVRVRTPGAVPCCPFPDAQPARRSAASTVVLTTTVTRCRTAEDDNACVRL